MPNYDPAQTFGYNGGTFGNNVSPINMPNPALDLGNQIPGLGGLNKSASGVIGNELSGKLNPDTIAAIRDASAGHAVSSGMPGAAPDTLGGNRTLRDFGITSMQQQQQGLKDYSSFVPTVSSTQTVRPETQVDVNTQNALNAAAPNPGQAQSYAEGLFDKYLKQLNGGSKTGPANKNSYIERDASGNVTRANYF